MNKSLTDTLNILFEGRQKLLETYIDGNSDRYRYSFQYFNKPSSLNIAICLLDHQWLDKQYEIGATKLKKEEISKETYLMLIKTLQKHSVLHQENCLFIGHQDLLKTKIEGLTQILQMGKQQDEKLSLIQFDQYRDKVLFEREMEKFLKCDG